MTILTLRLEDDPRCRRCTGPVSLLTRLPHQREHRTIELCPRCDHDDPDAQGILAFFAVHETITDDNLATAAKLIEEWTTRAAASAAGPRTDAEQADYEDYLRWCDGD